VSNLIESTLTRQWTHVPEKKEERDEGKKEREGRGLLGGNWDSVAPANGFTVFLKERNYRADSQHPPVIQKSIFSMDEIDSVRTRAPGAMPLSLFLLLHLVLFLLFLFFILFVNLVVL